ncbi:MAG: hypothetical protein ABIH76_05695 [Candidatus Bathyarchaeota archaeon]
MLARREVIDSWLVQHPTIEKWINEQTSKSTRNLYSISAYNYFLFLKKKRIFNSLETMLEDFEHLRGKELYRHIDIAKEFIISIDAGVSTKRNAWTAIRNLYNFNRTPLPQILHSETSKLFAPAEQEKIIYLTQVHTQTPMTREDFASVLASCNDMYRGAFMFMFQAALGIAEFEWVNKYAWNQIKGQLTKSDPIRIDLFRQKTSNGKLRKYYTFLGRDAIQTLKTWLKVREIHYQPMDERQPIFVCYARQFRKWTPLNKHNLENTMSCVAKKLKLIPAVQATCATRYKIHPHEMRDLFKSLCTISGVSKVAAEFFMGHDIDKLGYDKSPEMPEGAKFFMDEYRKVEPLLNVISNPQADRYDAKVEEQASVIAQLSKDLVKVQGELAKQKAFEKYVYSQLKQKRRK